MNELLTLAITETLPQKSEFNVIALDKYKQEFISIKLSKDEIIDSYGKSYWDIGYVTRVSYIEVESNYNNNTVYRCTGYDKISSNISTLKDLLERKSRAGYQFFENKTTKYKVMKVKKLVDIKCNYFSADDTFKTYLTVELFGDTHGIEERKLLCKDYRWIHYWKWINSKKTYEEKRTKFIEMINASDKTMFVLLYRHNYGDLKKHEWIVGLHWI